MSGKKSNIYFCPRCGDYAAGDGELCEKCEAREEYYEHVMNGGIDEEGLRQ